LDIGTLLRPLIAEIAPQTLAQECAGLRFEFLQRKWHRAFIKPGQFVPAKLSKSAVGYAGHLGTMPPPGDGLFRIELSLWQSRVKSELQKQVTLQATGQANKPNAADP
jgi:hypothetical protein